MELPSTATFKKQCTQSTSENVEDFSLMPPRYHHHHSLSRRLMIGFMSVSAFLSMWISNTATTAMMLPIAHAVLQQLKDTETQANERDLQAQAVDNHAFELEVQTKPEMIHERDTRDPVCK